MNKPKTKEEWIDWCYNWDSRSHADKVEMCRDYAISYDTGRHWRSDCGIETRTQTKITMLKSQDSAPVVNTPMLLNTGEGITTFAIIGDTHIPYHDEEVVATVEGFLGHIQPDYLIYNGDINDFYQVSVFAKDPARLGELQSDIDITVNMFERHTKLMPNTKKILIDGTHENRWIKYLQNQSPAVSKLRCNSIQELYELNKYDIEHVEFERGILVNNTFLILHGSYASKHSSYTAKMQYEANGGNGICNHTHRGGSYFKRDRFGMWGWWENFCLCRLDPDWIQNPNWQHGFSLVHFKDDGRFWVEQIPIINNKFMYGGQIYG